MEWNARTEAEWNGMEWNGMECANGSGMEWNARTEAEWNVLFYISNIYTNQILIRI
jgi:hypothetical protein